MDVTCERCGTEYDFDETLVSERGTTVKCTNCGHLFKVWKHGVEASAEATARPWVVKRAGGATETVPTLRDLQRKITEGALHPDDEISRSGEGWKKLGNIAELDTFFAASRAAARSSVVPKNDSAFSLAPRAPFNQTPSSRPPELGGSKPDALASTIVDDVRTFQVPKAPRPPSLDTGKQTVMGIGPTSSPPPPGAKPRSVPPPPPPGGKGTLMGIAPSSAPPSRPAPPPPRISMAIEEDRTDAGRPSVKKQRATAAPAAPSPPLRAPSVRPVLIEEEDRTEFHPRKRKQGGSPWLAAFFAAVLVGAVGAIVWFKFGPPSMPDPSAARERILHEGDARLAEDDDASYSDAIVIYARAQATSATDGRALASISRVQALWAQALIFDADDLAARAVADPGLRALADRVRNESRTHANEAKRYAEMAMRAEPTLPLARLAMADAYRLVGDATNARSSFELARGNAPDASADALRVGALLAVDAGGRNLALARPLAERAAQKDPSFAPAQILLARACLSESNVACARSAVDAVLHAHPQHARAQALKDAMDRGLPPAAPVLDTSDAGVASPAATAMEPVPTGRDYSFYVGEGESLLANHATHRAKAYFEAALRTRAGDARALTGLGFVAMNEHDYATAVTQFEAASNAGSADAMIGLGEAYRRLQRDEDALRIYQRYLQQGGPEAAIARHWVEVLTESLHGPGVSAPPLSAPTPAPSQEPTQPAPEPQPEPAPSASPPAAESGSEAAPQ